MSNRKILTYIVKIFSGGAFGQVVAFLLLPYISNFYGPGGIGIYGVYTSIISVLSILFSLRYDFFISPAESDEESSQILLITLYLICAFTGLSIILTPYLYKLIELEYLYLIPMGAALNAVYQALSFHHMKRSDFQVLSLSKAAYAGGIAIIQVVVGYFSRNEISIIYGHLLGQILVVLILLKGVKVFTYRIEKKIFERYLYRGVTLSISGVINSAAAFLPIIMFGQKFGIEVAGWITLAQRLFATPLDLLGSSISQVVVSTYGNTSATLEEKSNTIRVSISLISLFSILTFLASFYIYANIERIFSSEWYGVSTVILPIALIYIFRLIGNTLIQLVIFSNNEKYLLILDIARLISLMVIFFGLKLGLLQMLYSYAGVMMCIYGLQFTLSLWSLRRGKI